MASSRKTADLTAREKGAAFIAWYDQALKDHPGGLITRAQAATVLGISQMAVSRLIGRGHIGAKFFPKEPEVEQLPVHDDDPFWLRLGALLGALDVSESKPAEWIQACYVSLDDVKSLWSKGEQVEKARIHWDAFWKDDVPKEKRGRQRG